MAFAVLIHTYSDETLEEIGGLDDACPDVYLRHETRPAPTEDQDFIAHARQDVPRLVAEVRRLRELNAER